MSSFTYYLNAPMSRNFRQLFVDFIFFSYLNIFECVCPKNHKSSYRVSRICPWVTDEKDLSAVAELIYQQVNL